MRVRHNFAYKMHSNYNALKYASPNEWALLKALIANGCLKEEIETINDIFNGIDIKDTDGKVSFEEVLGVAEESGYFKKALQERPEFKVESNILDYDT